MKTKSEKKYVDLMISMIMHSDDSIEEKERRMKIFFNNHSYFYDNLCDNIYSLLFMSGTNVLTVDDEGNSYVNLHHKKQGKRYYDVLVLNEYSPFCSDVVMLVDLALNYLSEVSKEQAS